MKKLLLSASLIAGLAAGAYAQGFIALDNNLNTGAGPTATSNGRFWLQPTATDTPALINQDFNVSFLASSTSTGTFAPLATFLLSDHTADTGNLYGAGTFTDPTGQSYMINGVASGGTAYFQVQAWLGNYTSYSAALAAGGITGQSTVFGNSLGGGTTATPDLVSMPAVVLTAPVPEPSTFALAGLGAAAMLIFRRRK